MNGYILLAVAIISEIAATTALKATKGFTVFLPSILVIFGYALAFYMLGHVVKTIPVGIVYALWSGLGIIGTAILAFFLYGQKLDLASIIGIGLILLGVLVIQLFSGKSA